jgi:hypothetical protein
MAEIKRSKRYVEHYIPCPIFVIWHVRKKNESAGKDAPGGLHGIEIGRKKTKEFTCNTYIPDKINNEEKMFSCTRWH